jgi:nitronate monooxygenase
VKRKYAAFMRATDLSKRFHLKIPLVVAPMSGGPSTPELVSESCNSGALGSLGLAYLSPKQISLAIDQTREKTSKPFLVNLFTPMPEISPSREQIAEAIGSTLSYRKELKLPEPVVCAPFHPDFDQQFEAVMRAKPAAFGFIFGILDSAYLQECRKQQIVTFGTATTLEEGIALEESGVDVVIAQGTEAGGHRGIFNPSASEPGIRILDLTRSLVKKIKIPIVSAGGIMDAKGILSVLSAGAQAAQMGTAFLLCREAGTPKPYRKALQEYQATELTRVFSGRIARGLPNRFMKEMKGKSFLPFPAQNSFTRDIRNKSVEIGSADFLSLWAGEGVKSIRADLSAHQLIEQLTRELA